MEVVLGVGSMMRTRVDGESNIQSVLPIIEMLDGLDSVWV